jgi:hypothetical protein
MRLTPNLELRHTHRRGKYWLKVVDSKIPKRHFQTPFLLLSKRLLKKRSSLETIKRKKDTDRTSSDGA